MLKFSSQVSLASEGRKCRKAIPKDLTKRSLRKGITGFVIAFGVYLLTVAAFLFSPWLWGKVISSLALGFAMAQLFHIGHDGCHGSLTPNPKVNRWLARIAFLPILHSYSLWDMNHNRIHHAFTNYRPLDKHWAPLTLEEYNQLSPWGRFWERVYRSGWGFGIYYFKQLWNYFSIITQPIFKDKVKSGGDTVALILWNGGYLLLLALAPQFLEKTLGIPALPIWASLLGGFVVPTLIWSWLLGLATYLHHNHPNVAWYENEDEWSFFQGHVAGTTHIEMPNQLFRLLTWDLMEHTIHHANMSVPFYNLAAAQAALEQAYGDLITVQSWSWSSYVDNLTRCKLYDFDQHRWLDFAGNPTTESLRPSVSETSTPDPEQAQTSDAELVPATS